jgi:hypothetical protein
MGFFPELQSAYRRFHSTETALLRVRNDILLNMNKQQVTLLVCLDLSAAFETIEHTILLQRLEIKFGFGGTALKSIREYLLGRFQQVIIDGVKSDKFDINIGVPQGSCLAPLLFSIKTSQLFEIVSNHLPTVHGYAMIRNCTWRFARMTLLLRTWPLRRWKCVLRIYGTK